MFTGWRENPCCKSMEEMCRRYSCPFSSWMIGYHCQVLARRYTSLPGGGATSGRGIPFTVSSPILYFSTNSLTFAEYSVGVVRYVSVGTFCFPKKYQSGIIMVSNTHQTNATVSQVFSIRPSGFHQIRSGANMVRVSFRPPTGLAALPKDRQSPTRYRSGY